MKKKRKSFGLDGNLSIKLVKLVPNLVTKVWEVGSKVLHRQNNYVTGLTLSVRHLTSFKVINLQRKRPSWTYIRLV